MNKPIQELICIHLVASTEEQDAFHKYMYDMHSHGMKELNNRELQVVLSIDPKLATYAINNVAEKILAGDIEPKDGLLISDVFTCDIRLNAASDTEGEPLWRIVFPDQDGKFPEETDDRIYAMQAYSPYLKEYLEGESAYFDDGTIFEKQDWEEEI